MRVELQGADRDREIEESEMNDLKRHLILQRSYFIPAGLFKYITNYCKQSDFKVGAKRL